MSFKTLTEKLNTLGIARVEFSSSTGSSPRLYSTGGELFNASLTHWFLNKHARVHDDLIAAYHDLLVVQPLLATEGNNVEVGITTKTGAIETLELREGELLLPLGLSSVMAAMGADGVDVLSIDRDESVSHEFSFLVNFTPRSNTADHSHQLHSRIMNLLDQSHKLPLVIDRVNQTLRVGETVSPFSYETLFEGDSDTCTFEDWVDWIEADQQHTHSYSPSM